MPKCYCYSASHEYRHTHPFSSGFLIGLVNPFLLMVCITRQWSIVIRAIPLLFGNKLIIFLWRLLTIKDVDCSFKNKAKHCCNDIWAKNRMISFCSSLLPPHLLGLQTTRLGNHLEERVNKFLRRQNHPEAGEVFVRVVASSDKTVEVKPGMKSRWVLLFFYWIHLITITNWLNPFLYNIFI